MNKQELKYILLGMLVFLLIIGGWFIYHQKTRTDILRPDEVLIPTEDGKWIRDIFFIEEPFRDLDVYKVNNENKLFPNFYRESISTIKPEVQTFLNKRNQYIKGFEKKFSNSTIYMEGITDTYFLKPFTKNKAIREIFPVTSKGKERILIIGLDLENYHDSNLYLLDTNYKLLDQVEYQGFMGKSVISVNFLNQIWLQINGGGGSTWTLIIDQLFIEDDQIIVKDFYHETEYEVEGIFDTFKVTQASTNPTLTVYDKGKSDTWFFVFVIIVDFILSMIEYIFIPFHFITIVFLLTLIFIGFLYRKKFSVYLRKLLKKWGRKQKQ